MTAMTTWRRALNATVTEIIERHAHASNAEIRRAFRNAQPGFVRGSAAGRAAWHEEVDKQLRARVRATGPKLDPVPEPVEQPLLFKEEM